MRCRNCAKDVDALVEDRCAACLAEGLGVTREKPYVDVPQFWQQLGCPYGAYCKCRKCGLVARSTMTFDFYADGRGLACENCKIHNGQMNPEAEALTLQAMESVCTTPKHPRPAPLQPSKTSGLRMLMWKPGDPDPRDLP